MPLQLYYILLCSLASISVECFRNEAARSLIIKKTVAQQTKKEIIAMCSDTVNSILQQSGSEDISGFKWEKLINELALNAPTLLQLLQCSTTASKKNVDAIIGMCTALFCKHQRNQASLIQKIISIILYSGHTSKQVCCLYFCLFSICYMYLSL